MKSLLFALILTGLGVGSCAADETPLVGIDHIPTAVRDLDVAAASYRALGFVLKPGHLHDDSIANLHAKYPDGTEIELITASQPKDALAAKYLRLLAAGEGPAFLALHCRDFERLPARLAERGIGFERGPFFTLEDPRLDYLFFDSDNRSPTDRPEHFAHANGTTALIGVWLADAENPALIGLLTALGAPPVRQAVHVPTPTSALVSKLENGEVILLPRSYRLLPDRPIIGAVLAVKGAAGRAAEFVAPGRTHGLWLEFRPMPH